MTLKNNTKIYHPLQNKYFIIFISFISVFFFYILSYTLYSVHVPDSAVINRDYFNTNSKIISAHFPRNLNFSGELVPQNDKSIVESLEKEFTDNVLWRTHSSVYLRRIKRWFPVIEPILKKNGIPDDFKYLAIIESNLTNSVSPQNAVGFWQFIESTAINYGLIINDEVDERYHVVKATEAACKYFKEAYEHFHNWTLAAASYNLGIGGIEKKIRKQKPANYYDLILNTETARYVYRVLAIKIVIQNPEKYGFVPFKKVGLPHIPTLKIKVDSTIKNLDNYCYHLGYNPEVLRIFNPWIKDNSLTINNNTYTLTLPQLKYAREDFRELKYELLHTNTENDSLLTLQPEIPISDSLAPADSLVADPEIFPVLHQVTEGETILTIAEKFGVSEAELRYWNNLDAKAEPVANSELIIYPPVNNTQNPEEKK